LPSENEQAHDAADVVVITGAPERDELGIGKHPIARRRVFGSGRSHHGIELAQATPQRPGVHGTERGARIGGGGSARFIGDLGDAGGHVPARDQMDRGVVQLFEMRPGQEAHELTVGVWPHHLAPGGEIVLGHGPQGVLVLCAADALVLLRVLTEVALGENLRCRRAGAIGAQVLGRAEQHAACFAGMAILHNPRSAQVAAA